MKQSPAQAGPSECGPRLATRNLKDFAYLTGSIHNAWMRLAGPDGRGQSVLLTPGFMAGDWSMYPMAKALRSWNFRPVRIGLRLNVDCTNKVLTRLEQRLEVAIERYGHQVAVVGWSRGGILGKMLVVRRSELVSGLITIASPNVSPLAVNAMVRGQLDLLVRAHRAGVEGVLGHDCIYGECAAAMSTALTQPFPANIPYVSIYTPQDSVVDWRACLDPAAQLVEPRRLAGVLATDNISSIVFFDDAGHFVQNEAPELFNAALLSWLRDQPR